MKKTNFLNLIEKYNLGGKIESVIWEIKDKKCMINFCTDVGDLIGKVVTSDMDIPDSKFGIYQTSALKQMIGFLSDDMDIQLNDVNGKLISLQFSDKKFKSIYYLADTDVIPKKPSLKQLPPFNIELKFDNGFITDFVKASNAVTDDYVSFETFNNELKITLGYSSTQTNRVSWNVPVTVTNQLDLCVYSIDRIKSVLQSNKEIESATLEISEKGLMRILCKYKDNLFLVEYYLVQSKIN